MGKVLIVYFSSQSKENKTSEDKVADKLESIFSQTHTVKKVLLQSVKKLSLKEQFKLEKELKLNVDSDIVNEFDLVIIGSPTMGSLTSSPVVNSFLRALGKQSESKASPKYALFSTGIITGFAIKKMQSLLSMKGIKPIESASFTSIFDFNEKKMSEVVEFARKLSQIFEV